MEKNLFENLRERKQNVISLAAKAKDYGWLTPEREEEIRKKIEEDVLTIGVIGQMKCGKSTVLNAIVFKDDVLPSATTPMTAALSVITYGKEKKIKAEFYTPDEWEEQKVQASRSLSDVEGNALEESKIKAAKDLVKRSTKLGVELNGLLGTTKEDSLDSLEQYVGADGKYVSITKAVTIYYPEDYLKGVEIVDTPGFNDPIVSREERTKAFLNKADVVLLMLYAGRPFDATDRDILFKDVHQCGTGKVLIGINKYDIPYNNGEFEDEIKNYVKDEITKACRDCDDSILTDILKETEPIPLSAEMALLSELPMSKVNASEVYRDDWKRYCDDFEISSQSQMMEKSHLNELMTAIKKVIEKEKIEILLRKPLNAIINAGYKKKADLAEKIALSKNFISNASLPDEELEDRLEKLSKANKRLNKKIDALGDDIILALRNVIRSGKNTLEDDIDKSCDNMDKIVDTLKRFQSEETLKPKLEKETQQLIQRTLKRDTERIGDDAKHKLQKCVSEFIDEANDILLRYVPDFDTESFLKSLNKEVDFKIENNEVFALNKEGEQLSIAKIIKAIGDFEFAIFNVVTLGIAGKIGNAWSHNDIKKGLHTKINDLRSVDVSKYLDTILVSKDNILDYIKKSAIDEMLKPLQEQLNDIISNKSNKEQRLAEEKEKLVKLQAEEVKTETQLAEFMSM